MRNAFSWRRIAVQCFLLGLGWPALYAEASTIVAQSQLDHSSAIAAFSAGSLVQSFKQGFSNINGASIYLGPTHDASTITISVDDALPNAPGVNTLATAIALVTDANGWVNVDFGSDVPILPTATYYLVFSSTNSGQSVDGTGFDSYLAGEAYTHSGASESPTLDYAFQTTTDVPEGAWGGIGLAGILWWSGRRRWQICRV